jgi:hypothetical protein
MDAADKNWLLSILRKSPWRKKSGTEINGDEKIKDYIRYELAKNGRENTNKNSLRIIRDE